MRCLITVTILAAMTFTPAVASLAQEPRTVAEPRPVGGPASVSPDVDKVYSLRFQGGTLADYLQAVARAVGDDANIVTPPGAEQYRLGRVELRSVSIRTMVDLPRTMGHNVHAFEVSENEAEANVRVIPTFVVAVPQPSGGEGGARARVTFDIDFPGGNLRDYVNLVRERSGGANIAVIGPAEQISMGELTFKGVTVVDALTPINSVRGRTNEMEYAADFSTEGGMLIVEAEVQRLTGPLGSSAGPSRESRVWSLTEVQSAGPQRAEAILAAVEEGLLVIGEDAAVIRYHEPTSLLIAYGSSRAITIIEQVLEGAARTGQSRGRSRAEFEEARQRMQMADLEVNIAEQRLAAAEAELTQAKDLLDRGLIAGSDVERRKVALLKAEKLYDEARFELQRAEQRVRLTAEQVRDGEGQRGVDENGER